MDRPMRISTARKTLATNLGVVSPETVAAAELVADTAVAEPNWRAWLVADVAFAAALLLAPSPQLRWAIVAYRSIYVVAMWRQRDRVARLIAEHTPLADGPVLPGGVIGVITVVPFALLWAVIAMLPVGAIRAVGVVSMAFALRAVLTVPAGHARALATLDAAATTDWYAGWLARRDQHRAAVRPHI